jgi:hypothetical protein
VKLGPPFFAVALTLCSCSYAHATSVPEENWRPRFALFEVSSQLLSQSQILPTPFHLKDWMGENGSGGFPANHSDEHPLRDDWDEGPEQQ